MNRKILISLILSICIVLNGISFMPSVSADETGVLSQGKPTTASSVNKTTEEAKNAVDGKTSTVWAGVWKKYPQWWCVDLEKVCDIGMVEVQWLTNNERYYKYTIDLSNDGKSFTTVVDKLSNTQVGTSRDYLPDGTKARYVRVNIDGCSIESSSAAFTECTVYSADAVADYDGTPVRSLGVTLENKMTELSLTYHGTNGNWGQYYYDGGNGSKYLADIMFNMVRYFSTFEPDNDSEDEIVTAEDYDNAKKAVKESPLDNEYINWDAMNKSLVQALPNAATDSSGKVLSDYERIGVEPLMVFRMSDVPGHVPEVPSKGDYKGLWEWWENCFARAYLLSKNFGVTQYNLFNEPNFVDEESLIKFEDAAREGADAIRAGAAAAGVEAVIWGPTTYQEPPPVEDWDDYAITDMSDVFDVYDFHTYKDLQGATILLENALTRVARYSHKGIDHPIGISEYNIILNPSGTAYTYDYMSSAVKVAAMYKTFTENGAYGPLHFNLFRRHDRMGNALVHVDESTTMAQNRLNYGYYTFRMMNRAYLPEPGEDSETLKNIRLKKSTVDFDVDVMATTRNNEDYYILFINKSTENFKDYTIDLSALGFKDSKVTLREVSKNKNDEVIGVYQLQCGKLTVTDLPPDSIHLFTVSKNASAPSYVPEVVAGNSSRYANEFWWKNSPSATHYVIERRTEDGEFEILDDKCPNSFYDDYTAVPCVKYYYRVSAANVNDVGIASEEIGPLMLDKDPFTMPYRRDFENGSYTGWIVESGEWEPMIINDAEYLYMSKSEGKRVILTGPETGNNSYAINASLATYGVSDGKMAILAKYKDADNHYKFEYDYGVQKVSIIKVKDGVSEVLASENWKLTTGKRVHVSYIDGNNIVFYPSGDNVHNKFITAYDSDPLCDGRVGYMLEGDIFSAIDGMGCFPVFTEDFSGDKPRADWEFMGGNWEITGDDYHRLTQSSASDSETLAVNGSKYWKDLYLEVKCKINAPAASDGFVSVYQRWQDENNYLRYLLKPGIGIVAEKKINGVVETVATYETEISADKEYTIGIHNEKGFNTVYINGERVTTHYFMEPELQTGKIGIGTHNTSASFARVSVNRYIAKN